MNRFSLFLVLIAVALIASVASAETTCAYYSNGHIIGHSGAQYQVLTPGDYKLNDDVSIRQTQCPGAEEGVVCVTAVKIGGLYELHYNAEANIVKLIKGGVPIDPRNFAAELDVYQEFTGHEQGHFIEQSDVHVYFFPNAQAVFTDDLNADTKTSEGPNGLCGDYLGVYRNYDYENPSYPVDYQFNQEEEEYLDTYSKVKFNVVNATQEEIEEFAQTWTAARLGGDLISGHVADVNYGDFAAFESTTIETTELNDFFIHHHLCTGNGNAFSLRGLYKDYTDYEHCAHHTEENTVMHIFKKEFIGGEALLLLESGEQVNFQKYWEDYLEDESFLTDGKSKTAINLWAKIGGKYNFVTKYDNLCGQEVSFNTAVDIQCNQAPSVDIREDLSVSSGDRVVLHANMTDPEEDDLVVSWKIIQVPEDFDGIVHNVPAAEWGYDNHYFAFQTIPSLVGTYVVEVAVSDYCNVVYNTVKVEVRCEECSDTRINLESSNEKLRLNGLGAQYEETTLNFITSDQNPVDVQSVKITPRDTDTYYFLDDGESNIKIYTNEAVAETKDPVEESNVVQECNFEENDINGDGEILDDHSFKRSLLIPTLNRRGYVVVDVDEDSEDLLDDPETHEFRRVQGNVLHHLVACKGKKSTVNETKTTEVFETPAQYLCELDYEQDGTEVDLTLTKQTNVRDQCNMIFHVNATGEIGDCNRPLVSTVFPLTSDCRQPEANPRCPIDTYEFDYSGKTWTSVKLNGEDSHDGFNREFDGGNSDIDFTNTLKFKWSLLENPEYANVDIPDDELEATQLTLNGHDIEGQYLIELRVDNDCLNDTREIMIEAKCPLPAPTATIDIAEGGSDNTVEFTINDYDHEYHDSEIYDVNIEFEAHVTDYPRSDVDNFFEEISAFLTDENEIDNIRPNHGRYVVIEGVGLVIPEDEDVDPAEVVQSANINGITTDGGVVSYRPEGDYQITGRVTDGCKHTSEQSNIGVVCIGDEPDVSIQDPADPTGNSQQITIDRNTDIVLYCHEHNGIKECDSVTGNSFTVQLSEGSNKIEIIGFNSVVCGVSTDSVNIDFACADVSFDMSASSRTLTSQHSDTYDLVIDGIESDGDEKMEEADADVEVCLIDANGDCVPDQTTTLGNLGITLTVDYVPEDTDNDVEKHWEASFATGFIAIGTFEFNVKVTVDGCSLTKKFTLRGECIDDITAEPTARDAQVSYTHNGFASVSVGALLQNADDEDKIHPDDEIVYFWEFVGVPEDSAYFAYEIEEVEIEPKETTSGSSISYVPVDPDYDVPADSPALFKERETTVFSTESVLLRRTLKRSVLNLEDITVGTVEDFADSDYYIAHKKYMPGCFTPDVAGTYELELKTAFAVGRVQDVCPIPAARVTVTAECNAAPTLNVVGANDEGVIEVDITRDSYDYSRVVVSLEASDADNDHLSIEWSWTGGIMEGRPGAERELRESGLDADDTLDNELRYAIVDGHSRDPSFLVGVAGDYKLTVAVDDGCTRVTRDVIVRVGCGGSQFSATADDVTHSFQYRSVVDIDQFAFSTVPSTSGDYFCQNPLFKSVEVKSWDLPDQFSSSARAVVQPIVAMVAMIFALLAIFY